MNRKIQEPFTLPEHGKLQDKINDMIIAIKVHELIEIDATNEKQMSELMKRHNKPTWQEIIDTLNEAYHALNQHRLNPIKY